MILVYRFGHPNSYDQNIKSWFTKKAKLINVLFVIIELNKFKTSKGLIWLQSLKHSCIKSLMFIGLVYYEIKRVSFAKVTLPYSYTMGTSVDESEWSDQ